MSSSLVERDVPDASWAALGDADPAPRKSSAPNAWPRCIQYARGKRWQALLAGAALLAGSAQADEGTRKPRWELGVGLAPLTVPAYRGADRQRFFLFPIPFVVYRGDWLRVDRGGAQGLLWNTERTELDISVDGAVPVDNSDDGPRAGMQELDPLVEVGPSLNILVQEDAQGRLELQLPVRAAVSIGGGETNQQGWKFHPQLNYDAPKLVRAWDVSFSIGPKFGSRLFHAYYYDVPKEAARPDRPAFNADAGYSGLSMLASTSRRFDEFWVGAFVRYDNLAGARFVESPLVETRHAVSAGLAISWVLWQSETTVHIDPSESLGAGE